MIRIRPAQLEAFEEAADRAFERRLCRYLREHHEAAVANVSEDALAATVHTGLRQARRYGLADEASITTFVALLFEIGPAFDRQPFIQSILSDETLPPELRMEVLDECTTETQWEEAAALRDEGV